MDKIIIKDLLLRGIIGINPDERTKKQDIPVSYTHLQGVQHHHHDQRKQKGDHPVMAVEQRINGNRFRARRPGQGLSLIHI